MRVSARKSNLMLPSDSGGVWLSFCFLRTPDTSRVPTEAREHEARERGNFSAPRLWLKCWVLLPKAARGGGTPLTPGGLGRWRRQPPPGPGRITTTPRQRPPPAKRNERARARTRRATGTSPARARGASSGAQPARPPARNRRVLRRATGAFPGAQNVASPGAQNGAFPGAQSGMSPDTRPARLPTRELARLPARRRHASTACKVFGF